MKTIVSIIVPCFNQAQYLDECLQSVLDQTFQDWECIIVNDGSPDNTKEIAQEWIAKDSRFKYISIANSGVCNARNVGIQSACGEFILPLDADDKIGEKYCELAIEEFGKNLNLKVVYCRAEKFGAENGEWFLGSFSLKKMCEKNIIFCSSLFRKSEWDIVNGYDNNMIEGFEDWEFWIALLKNGGDVSRLEYYGFYYRLKLNSRNNSINSKNDKRLKEYISSKHVEFFVKNVGSFPLLLNHIKNIEDQNRSNLKSKRYVLNLFFKTFFKFQILLK